MLHIRNIIASDNGVIEKIIKDTLKEFKANKPGTVYFDPQTAYLFEYYKEIPRSNYYIATYQNKIVGGAGYGPTDKDNPTICELQKLYLHHSARGRKIGKSLIEHCLNEAKQDGYNQMYLETLPELISGLKLYEKMGFEYTNKILGSTGHDACDIKMIRDIK